MTDDRGDSPAAALARLRWKDKTEAERSDHGRMMADARWEKERRRKKVEGLIRTLLGENRPPDTPVDPKV